MKEKLLPWLPTILWMVLIFILSSIPKLELTEEPFWNFLTRKLAHLFEYSVLFLLMNRSLEGKRPILAFVFTLTYAVSDEIHQIFVPLRQGSPVDILVDGIGASLAWLLARHFAWTHEEK